MAVSKNDEQVSAETATDGRSRSPRLKLASDARSCISALTTMAFWSERNTCDVHGKLIALSSVQRIAI